LDLNKVRKVQVFAGTQLNCKLAEKILLLGYFAENGHLLAGNSCFR